MTALVDYEKIDDIAVITMSHPPVNALGLELRTALADAFERFRADTGVRAAVLRGTGRHFCAGVDISEFDQPPQSPWLPQLVAQIESQDKPVIAAIHGSALGGGLELAMACHYRCALPDARLGLPEVNLGLLPGASGTQRLPRLTGVATALEMMCSGRPVDARKAREMGIIDRIVDGDLLTGAIAWTWELIESASPPRRLSETALEDPEATPEFFSSSREALLKRSRGQEAPLRILECLEAAVTLPWEAALAREAELFEACRTSPQSAALRHLFFAEREVGRVPGLSGEIPVRPLSQVAVIGAGTMGRGIAMALANSGLPVILLEKDPAQLDRALEAIAADYRAAVKKGRLAEGEPERRLELISRATEYEAIAEADLVIEAVFEEMSVKQEVFRQLDQVCRPETILASNTSSLDLDRIAAFTSRPEQVIGLHFFAPANIMRLLEIVRGRETSDEVLRSALELSKRLGKIGVVVGVCYGFVGNRMFLPYLREAELMMLEGVPPERIDAVARDWGMAMGPHAVTDLSGLDVFRHLNAANPERPDDPAWFRVCDLLCEAGRLGQKSGAGIYRYEGRKALPDPEVTEMVRREAERLGIPQREIDDQEILERLLLPMINEGALILEQGIALRPGDIDVIFANGYGFPRHRGGPMFHADQLGLGEVLAGIGRYGERYGERYWTPAPLLRQLAGEGGSFSGWSAARGR